MILRRGLLVVWVFIGLGYHMVAQNLNQVVDLNYSSESLSAILADLTGRYAIRFAYSSDRIPLAKKYTYRATQLPMNEAFEGLFKVCQLDYAIIGGQIALKPRPAPKRKTIGRIQPLHPNLPEEIEQQSPLYANSNPPRPKEAAIPTRKEIEAFSRIKRPRYESVPGGDRVITFDPYRIEALTKDILEEDRSEPTTRLAQVSILPYVGTNALKSNKMTNNMSINLLWGTNGGVDGVEVGGLVNNIKHDVKGVQVAGLGNTVKEDVVGTQVGGLFNAARGEIEGVQVAGLFNRAHKGRAVQVAGLFNVAADEFEGVQAAGLFNHSNQGNAHQFAFLFNSNRTSVGAQLSGLLNNAGDVSRFQVAPLMNAARNVDGFQLGLVNVADTVSGVSVGLLNFIKKGYNRFEIGSSELLLVNSSIKLGTKRFYNIIHGGVHWEKIPDLSGNGGERKAVHWGIGYGIGSSITLRPWLWLNLEALAIHINEDEPWTNELNLLNEYRVLFDIHLGRKFSVYVGPTLNLLISERFNAETNVYGSQIPPYAFNEKTVNQRNTKMWIGVNGGIRF